MSVTQAHLKDIPMAEQSYFSIGDVTLLFINEGYTRYAVARAIDRLKILNEITVESDPTDERVKRIKQEFVGRIRQYLQTGK
jgi:hypothetical protein